jgi:hypothetical protein
VLYSFSSFTFTAAGTFGNTGPTQATLLNSYDTAQFSWLTDTSFYKVETEGIQEWTVPVNGIYRIETVGASGGIHSGDYYPGFPGAGAKVQADISLTGGEKIYIVVGQKPSSAESVYANGLANVPSAISPVVPRDDNDDDYVPVYNGSAGGGGTFLYRGNSALAGIGGAGLLMVAGGGGGTGHGDFGGFAGNGKGGSSTTDSNESARGETFGVNSRQTNGSAGNLGISLGGRVSTVDGNLGGGGGAGWTGDGESQSNDSGRGGTRFVGGTSEDGAFMYGGFGGGGGSGGSGNSGGGGGGYTGGGGGNGYDGTKFGGGGGGGSFVIPIATNIVMTEGAGGIDYADTSNGFVVITRL